VSNEPTYDLTVPGLTESALRLIASRGDNGYVGTAARVRLAEIDAERANTEAKRKVYEAIDAERAAAVKATERRRFRTWVPTADGGRYEYQVLASTLRAGDSVEGRTVESVDLDYPDAYVRWADAHGTYYGPGVLVLLDSEVAT
jgi:hypothetical protein